MHTLLEPIIAIFIFAICAAVCASILADSHILASDTRDTKNALIRVQSGADCFKAAAGNAQIIAGDLGGISLSGADNSERSGAKTVVVYYDEKWDAGEKDEAAYIMNIVINPISGTALLQGEISIESVSGEEIISLIVAVRSVYG
jgi:hypothetical protein